MGCFSWLKDFFRKAKEYEKAHPEVDWDDDDLADDFGTSKFDKDAEAMGLMMSGMDPTTTSVVTGKDLVETQMMHDAFFGSDNNTDFNTFGKNSCDM